MSRLSGLLIVLLVLPMAACATASVWMAGIDPDRYGWEPMAGTKDGQNAAQTLRDCEGQATPAKPGAVAITRAESSPTVNACMMEKGYRKVYEQRDTMF